jgi:hypothetical protein
MTRIAITKKDTSVSIREKMNLLELSKGRKLFDPKKYLGKVKGFGDALAFQKKMRDDWK